MLRNRHWMFVVFLIFCAAFARLIPHAPNFTPVLSLALFAGSAFENKKLSFLVPIIAMLLSDALIGFHELVPVIYLSMLLIVLLGFITKRNFKSVALMSTIASVLFFVLSNIAVWAFTSYYPKNVTGLSACFIAAIPFFAHTLISAYVYSAILFGALAINAQRSRVFA